MAIRRKRRVNAIEEGKESARWRGGGWRKGGRANEEVGGSGGGARERDGDCAGGIKPARERVRDGTNQGNALSSAAS